MDIGLRRVIPGFRVSTYLEREAFAAAHLVEKIQRGLLDDAPVWDDLSDFPYEAFAGQVDLAFGGLTCQPHSSAGKRKGGGDGRFLFSIWLDGLALMRPRQVFIENVPGLLTSRMPDRSLCIRWIFNRLEEIGYRVEDGKGQPLCGLFSAAECGAPHRRQRLFILAQLAHPGRVDLAGRPPIQRPHGDNAPERHQETGDDPRCCEVAHTKDADWRPGNGGSQEESGAYGEWRQRSVGGGQTMAGPLSSRQPQPERRISDERGWTGDGGKRLGYAESGGEMPTEQQGRLQSPVAASEGMADPQYTQATCEWNGGNGDDGRLWQQTALHWPGFVSQPGQPQYGWEPPRTIPPQRRLGGGTDGHARRVDTNTDRLGMLGNSCYAPTVALAYHTLNERLNEKL